MATRLMQFPAQRKKVVVVGDEACGKTSLLNVFKKGKMPTTYMPTVFENYIADVEIDKKNIELSLFDTAGQESYNRLRSLLYHGTDVVILCYSVTNPESFENAIEKWAPEVRQHCPGKPIILCGNKQDLCDDENTKRSLVEFQQSPVSYEKGLFAASDIGAVTFLECSALTIFGVDDVFKMAAKYSVAEKEKRGKFKKMKSVMQQHLCRIYSTLMKYHHHF